MRAESATVKQDSEEHRAAFESKVAPVAGALYCETDYTDVVVLMFHSWLATATAQPDCYR
jgi:hypothetical protein